LGFLKLTSPSTLWLWVVTTMESYSQIVFLHFIIFQREAQPRL